MKLKRTKKNKFTNILIKEIVLIIISFILSIIVINYFSSQINKKLIPIAEAKTKKFVTTIINNSTNNLTFDTHLIEIDKDSDNVVKMIRYNSLEVTKLINEITYNIQNNLDKMEHGEYEDKDYVIGEVKLGTIFNSTLLNNLGPEIKIRFQMFGDIVSNIETEVKPYGINNAYIEMRVYLNVHARIILPFVTKEIEVSNVIPLSMNIISGSVPNGYITTYK